MCVHFYHGCHWLCVDLAQFICSKCMINITQVLILHYISGLLRDDCLYETEDVTEALRRIPSHVVDERNFRMVRAMQLSLQKTILPKEEWTKYEEDKLYLSPVVEAVKKERLEREQWEKDYQIFDSCDLMLFIII